jgi:putative DNA-invertase from lambdoid prophage Rac
MKKVTTKKEVLGYLRTSTFEGESDEPSLDAQEMLIRNYAVNLGLVQTEDEVRVFWDRGKAAFKSKTDKRIGWTHMMNFAEKGDVIIAASVDRCFRSASDAALTIETLRLAGISLHFIDAGCVLGKGDDKNSIIGVLSSIAAKEASQKSEKLKAVKSHMANNFLYGGGRKEAGFTRAMISNKKFLVVNQLEKQLLLLIADAKKHRDSEMKKTGLSRVKNKSEWSLTNIRKKLIEKIIGLGIENKILLDEKQIVFGYNPYGVWDETQRNRNVTDDSGDEQGKLFHHESIWQLRAERMAFSIASIHHLVSDDEKRNVFARLKKIIEAEKKIRLVDGEYVLAKDLAGTSRIEGTAFGHRQASLLGVGMRTKQKKDKVISTRRKPNRKKP